jgi:hypothetical protein
MSEAEAPVANDLMESADGVVGDENLRKIPGAYNYMEEFDNYIFYKPVEGFSFPEGLYPGTGEGSATRFGKGKKSYSFINQFASIGQTGLNTIGAPVTDVFEEKLVEMGLNGIPSAVSSLTTDGDGNALWFENIENVTSQVAVDRINFRATIKVIGGNGKFSDAFGEGVVEGYFNPIDGIGKSKVMARINY